MGKTKVWTRDDVARRILAGQNIVIFRNHALLIPSSWLNAHPGGSITILHFVGRDATDELEAYHSATALDLINKYAIATIEIGENGWEPMLPPVMSGWVRKLSKDGSTAWHNEASPVFSTENTELAPSSQILLVEKDHTDDEKGTASGPSIGHLIPPPAPYSAKTMYTHSTAYRALHQRIKDAGFYQTPWLTGVLPEVLRFTSLGTVSAIAYKYNWLMTSAVFLGGLWHQLVFFCHDLGHNGVSHDWFWDRLAGICLADFIGGLSIGWWVENHNVHHLVTNHPIHDPDIQHIPFFAITPVFFQNLWSSYYKRTMPFDRVSKILIAIQHRLFYVVLALARFNLYRLSYVHLFFKAFDTKRARGGRWAWTLEIIGVAFFWYWFSHVLMGCGSWKKALAYLVVSHVTTGPLHIQIVLSHFSMSTADLGPGEAFAARQMRTTTDVACPPELSFIHGGLHLQVTHHLFPRLPKHNLRAASALVKEFAKEQGLTYAEFGGFVSGNKEVLGVLRGVAEQVKVIGMVGNAEAKEAVERKMGVYKEKN